MTKKHQVFLLPRLPASLLVASSLLFPASHLQAYPQAAQQQGTAANSFLLAANSFLPLTTSKQILDQPYYQVRAPGSLLPDSQGLAISDHLLVASRPALLPGPSNYLLTNA